MRYINSGTIQDVGIPGFSTGPRSNKSAMSTWNGSPQRELTTNPLSGKLGQIIQNDWTPIQIGVCTGPVASWHTLWPHLKHYG